MKNLLEGIDKASLKKRNLGTVVLEVVLLSLSAFVLALAFPGFVSKNGVGFFVFFALIPVFAVVRNSSWKSIGLYGFWYGWLFYWIFNYWLSSFHPLANYVVQIIKGAEMVLLFFSLKVADRWLPEKLSFIAQSIIWVAYTYLAQSWFAGYPYGTIAYALFRYKILIQIADIGGIWLLNFLIVLPQAFVGLWCCKRFSATKDEHCPSFREMISANRIFVIVYAALIVVQIVYGIITYSYWKHADEDNSFAVATVQHNADSWKGGFATYQNNFDVLSGLSKSALTKHPDLIVWSETAFVPSVNWYTNYPYEGDDEGDVFDYLREVQGLVDEFVSFGENLGTPLLTGNPSSVLADGATSPYTEEGDWNKKDYNSVILFDDGEIKQTYLKQHLVPFTEHFPYEDTLPHLYAFLKSNDYHWWEEGTESVIFTTSTGITFSTPICFEDIFGSLCADFVANGADLFINMTNDSWSGSVAAERQHMAMSVFRAVENRRTMLRGTNSGITCLITPDGTIQGEMTPFTKGWKVWDVPVYSTETYGHSVYTNIKDITALVFVYVSYAILAFCLVSAAVHTFKKKS